MTDYEIVKDILAFILGFLFATLWYIIDGGIADDDEGSDNK